MHRILLIDDDAQLGPPLAEYFRRFDLVLEQTTRPEDGLARLAAPALEGGIAAVVLDVMLPGMDGFEVCRAIRRDPALATLPVLMLTARGDVMDRIVGLELGADDYLPKPFEPRELVARLQTVLRRARPVAELPTTAGATPSATSATATGGELLSFDGLTIDTARRSVRRHGSEIDLTGTEYELLLLLAREPGRVFSRDDILNRLRGHEAELYTRAVDLVVSRLRRKLEPLECIKTLRNAGYALALPRAGTV